MLRSQKCVSEAVNFITLWQGYYYSADFFASQDIPSINHILNFSLPSWGNKNILIYWENNLNTFDNTTQLLKTGGIYESAGEIGTNVFCNFLDI